MGVSGRGLGNNRLSGASSGEQLVLSVVTAAVRAGPVSKTVPGSAPSAAALWRVRTEGGGEPRPGLPLPLPHPGPPPPLWSGSSGSPRWTAGLPALPSSWPLTLRRGVGGASVIPSLRPPQAASTAPRLKYSAPAGFSHAASLGNTARCLPPSGSDNCVLTSSPAALRTAKLKVF